MAEFAAAGTCLMITRLGWIGSPMQSSYKVASPLSERAPDSHEECLHRRDGLDWRRRRRRWQRPSGRAGA